MAGSVNKVILVGRLGRDPEVRITTGGLQVCNLVLATSSFVQGDAGEKEEVTEWHRIVAFGRLAEICSRYLSKGRLVYVEGRLQTRKWEDRNGSTRYTTEVVMTNMQILDSRRDEEIKPEPQVEAVEPGPLGSEALEEEKPVVEQVDSTEDGEEEDDIPF